MGACDQKTTEAILDFFYENGGESPHLDITTGIRQSRLTWYQATSLTLRTTTSLRRASSGSENG